MHGTGDHPAIQFLHGVLESRKNKLLEYAELRVKQAEAELNREMKAHRKVVLFTWAVSCLRSGRDMGHS